MKKFSEFLAGLKKKLFGEEKIERKSKPILPSTVPKPTAKIVVTAVPSKRSKPYFFQIGFDFGTSYSKCVCRDIMTNKSWVHLCPKSDNQELPFLIPSTLIVKNNTLCHVDDPEIQYPENGLYQMKTTLVLVANGILDNPILDSYRNSVRLRKENQLTALVVTCSVYFLAGVFGEIREQIKKRFPDFGTLPEDYITINMAIPVEDAEQPKVSRLFHQVLCESWELSSQLSGHPPVHLAELVSLRKKTKVFETRSFDEACYIYPEVSASVQGFVRSRASSPGIYLYSDTGGGTVDQSVFIFMRQDFEEHLTYLSGRVLSLGSSKIEQYAAGELGKPDCSSLEQWRERKENGGDYPELKKAKRRISNDLTKETVRTLALTKQKLYVKDQLNDMKVIFGGGGNCAYPYQSAVMCPFTGSLFREALHPDVIGMPLPNDLELEHHETRWMQRLNVAYGLSFEKSELAPFTFPQDVSNPTPEELWQPVKRGIHAPSKEEC